MSAPRIGVPELAGLATYAEAARVGYAVDDNVARLLRYHWIEKRLAEIAVAHLCATSEWEVKGALALHQWLDSEHADALRARIREMRHPAPRLDLSPDRDLEVFLEQLDRARDTRELLTGLYAVARPLLLSAYREHYEHSNPLVDHPTRRVLRLIMLEEADALSWGRQALDALGGPEQEWAKHLRVYLEKAGGIMGVAARDVVTPVPRPSAPRDFAPQRDARFEESFNFNFPPHNVYALSYVPSEERNLALLCKRLLEMDVPEMMSSFLTERKDQPWEFYRDYRRQLWDEARHSMMGEVAFEVRGIDWTRIPLNIGFALRLNLHATPAERQLLLYAIEQSLMPADTGKRYEYNTALQAGDALSAHFHDYDWADEVLHAQIGRRWLKTDEQQGADMLERGRAVHERTWEQLEQYRLRQPQREWWSDFVKEVLGNPTAARPEDLAETKVVAE